MFFVSAVYSEYDFKIDMPQCIKLINSFRLLSPKQREATIDKLTNQLKPDNYSGNKLEKRDFHNWKNKAQQIFHLLDQTIYFEKRTDNKVDKITLRKTELNKDIADVQQRLHRSIKEKFNYFEKHKVEKTKGFELHHVIPLSWSESLEQFKLLDQWRNMLYIDGYNHAIISQNKNKHVKMTNYQNTIILSDYEGDNVILDYKDNVLYSTKLLPDLLNYNTELYNIYFP